MEEATGLIVSLPNVIQFILAAGALAAGLMAVIKLWAHIRPSIKLDLEVIKKERNELLAALDVKWSKEFGIVYVDYDKVIDRVSKIEKDIAAIDVAQINGRFDRMEKKIDDLTSLLIQRFTK